MARSSGSTAGRSTRRFDDIVSFAGLERFIDTPVKNYSSGMYVRLGFAVAINVEPEVLLIDEVLAVGDTSFQLRCMEKFAEIRDSGRTMVIVTHDLGTVRTLCDRATWLQFGEQRDIGLPGEVVDEYADEALAGRAPSTRAETRWGSGEVQITGVTLLDSAGRARRAPCAPVTPLPCTWTTSRTSLSLNPCSR